MELFVQLRYNFDQYPQSKMYTGEIITEAIILPDSLSPVKKKYLHFYLVLR